MDEATNWILHYSITRGGRDLVEHDDPAMRAPVLQAIEELARTSRTSTELWDECEVLLAETQWGWGYEKIGDGQFSQQCIVGRSSKS
jgi:hypothetical protein